MRLQDRHRTDAHQMERDALCRYVLLLRRAANSYGACGRPRLERIRRMEMAIENKYYIYAPLPERCRSSNVREPVGKFRFLPGGYRRKPFREHLGQRARHAVAYNP